MNFGVIEIARTQIVSAPGWAYVPDIGPQTPLTATQPISRKRARKPVLGINPGEKTAQQDAKLLRELALLDRDNNRDIIVPVPPKKHHEQTTGRGNHGKVTAAVRKILQSNKTFANYLADSEAAQAISASSNSGGFYPGSITSQVATPISRATPTFGSIDPALSNNSRRRSSKRRNASVNNGGSARGAAATARKNSLVAQMCSPTETNKMESTRDKKTINLEEKESPLLTPSVFASSILSVPHDHNPLLISWIPSIPSEDELKELMAYPPLSYLEARGPLVEEDRRKPARHFCERCGYWAKIKCVKCNCRLCALDCYREHKEECFRYGP